MLLELDTLPVLAALLVVDPPAPPLPLLEAELLPPLAAALVAMPSGRPLRSNVHDAVSAIVVPEQSCRQQAKRGEHRTG